MNHVDPKSLDLAFVPPGTPMLDAVLEQIESDEILKPSRRRDMASGLRCIAQVLGRAPGEVPADPGWLQPRLAKVLPAAHGLAEKTWRNVVSNVKSALAHVGIVDRRRNSIDDLRPEWRQLWEKVLASGDNSVKMPLRAFVYFLNRLGIAPGDVAEMHAIAYRDALTTTEIRKDPEGTYRAAVNGWNLAVQRIPGWPCQILSLPSRAIRIALPEGELPVSFIEDLDRFLGRLALPDPLDECAPTNPLAPTTIAHFRTKTIKFAGAVVRAGVPVEALATLTDLVRPEIVDTGLRWLLQRTNNKKTVDLKQMSSLLAKIGREYVRVDETDQARLDQMAARLQVPVSHGMTSKNRDRLRAFDDPATLTKLLQLPERLMARVPKKPTLYRDALLSEDAVVIALLLYCPIRRSNLASIRLDRNLQSFGNGRRFLVFESHDVKNKERIEFELPRGLMAMIDQHCRTRVPLICKPATPWLFPARRTDTPIDAEILAQRVKRRIEKELGVTMNLHLFRHLAAKVYLDANPGAYEVVRRLLGHVELSKTIAAYAGFEAGTATRLYAQVLEQRRSA